MPAAALPSAPAHTDIATTDPHPFAAAAAQVSLFRIVEPIAARTYVAAVIRIVVAIGPCRVREKEVSS
jgi:hypothetical protein